MLDLKRAYQVILSLKVLKLTMRKKNVTGLLAHCSAGIPPSPIGIQLFFSARGLGQRQHVPKKRKAGIYFLTLLVLSPLMADIWKSHLEGWPHGPLGTQEETEDKTPLEISETSSKCLAT